MTVPQHLCGLILSLWNRLNAGAIDLGKIRRVVEHKGDDDRGEAVGLRDLHAEHIVGGKIYHDHLKHERRPAHDGDVDPRDDGDDLIPVHAEQCHRQSQRERKQ